jgi:hypothetical protein
MENYSLNDITTVCVDCINVERALNAFKQNKITGIVTKKQKLLTSLLDNQIIDGVEIIKIPELPTLHHYSYFMVKALAGYIDTAYALIIQWDGYVLKGANWKNEFFKYDYIGAPWHNEWKKDHPYWNKNNTNEVGNGGFSLRSKRLLDFLASSSAITQIHPEDWAICKTYYNYLIEQKFKFAPTEMAYKFAVDGIPWDGQFGFHSIRATDLTKFKPCDL